MWGRALYTIQRVDRAGWDRLDIVSRWLIAARVRARRRAGAAESARGARGVREAAPDRAPGALAEDGLAAVLRPPGVRAQPAVRSPAALRAGRRYRGAG